MLSETDMGSTGTRIGISQHAPLKSISHGVECYHKDHLPLGFRGLRTSFVPCN